MPGWDTFAVIVGGASGALVGLLFVAISIHAARIAASTDLRLRGAQTLVVFATLLLLSVIIAIPSQPQWVVGAELITLAVVVAVVLVMLDRRAGPSTDGKSLSGLLKAVTPNVSTAAGVALTGALMVGNVRWASYVLVPTTCIAVVGGLTSAYLLLTKLSD